VGISILQPKLLGKWLLVFGILTTAACSAPPQSDFNPSAGAVHLKEEYGFDPAMAAATNDLPLQMPRSMRTDLDEQRWKVPPSLSWVQLRDHLAAQLGRGWSIDKHFSEQGVRLSPYRVALRRRNLVVGATARLVYVDVPADYDFAVLITFRPDR
jgi:hypothetical protein